LEITFFLHVLDEILAYQVDQIKVVEPEETSDLEIIPGGGLLYINYLYTLCGQFPPSAGAGSEDRIQ